MGAYRSVRTRKILVGKAFGIHPKMPDTFKIVISIDDETLRQLKSLNQTLRVYKGVKGGVTGGLCTLWYTTGSFLKTTTVTWQEGYGGYIDSQEFKIGAVIDANNLQSMEPGNLLTVQNDGSTQMTTSDVSPNDINIQNGGSTQWICGMGQTVGSNNLLSPVCALPLLRNDFRNITPSKKILLNFDFESLKTGTLAKTAWTNALLIDFAKTEQIEINVSYNTNNGWDAKKAVWAKTPATPIEIASLLLESTPRLRSAR